MKLLNIKSIVVLGLLFTSLTCLANNEDRVDWNYRAAPNVNPAQWGDYFPGCKPGGFQSPINISKKDVIGVDSVGLQLNFSSQEMEMVYDDDAFDAEAVGSSQNFVTTNGASYTLKQCHFHVPAENYIEGKVYPAEMHCVTQNKQGQYLVTAVLLALGKANAGFDGMLDESHKQHISLIKKVLRNLFPTSLAYYTFEGSLTTPACDRGIKWVIFKNPVTLSAEQLKRLQQLSKHEVRPVQAVNGRKISAGVAQES